MVIAARKIEAFSIEPSERWLFAGNVSGQISVIDIDKFSIVSEVQAHTGIIQAIAAHPQLPYIAALSTDRTTSIWRYDQAGNLSLVCHVLLRNIKPSNDIEDIAYIQSTSQAIGFHDSDRRLVTRSGNAGVLELTFDDNGNWQLLYCVRLHGEADLISARFIKDTDMVLTGSIDGQLVLSEKGEVIRCWQLNQNGNVHWAEHVEDNTYLLASDMRCIVRFDVTGNQEPLLGPIFTRDDLEHVTYNQTSKRAFVASFDRKIYEINPETCVPTRIAFKPPFKCRWIKTLERSPSTILVQSRDGAIYKANVDTGACIASIKETPDTLWTGVNSPNGSILLTGDGEFLLRVETVSVDPIARKPVFVTSRVALDVQPGSYTKRMVQHPITGRLFLGRTNGDVDIVDHDMVKHLTNLGSAIRDIDINPNQSEVFAACEDGHVYKIHGETGEKLLEYMSPNGRPIWSLVYSPERDLISFAERTGHLSILSGNDFSPVSTDIISGRPKRMKWVNEHTLLYNKLDQLYKFDLTTNEETLLVDSVGNTIEDFIWDAGKRYLVFISYTSNVYLCDFNSGELINWIPDQMDYSKGLLWVETANHPDLYPLDFLTFGRSGTAHHFRIHDEKILALGPVEFFNQR